MTTTDEGQLPIWVVYDHPADFPDDYVARKFIIDSDGDKPTTATLSASELESVRDALRGLGLVCITRAEQDDPVILESWL